MSPALEMLHEKPDPIMLSLFANRFLGTAEAMGRSLQQTSISTNIKERLDFSCALFTPSGDLAANAPAIPVHLGSMSHAVKYQIKTQTMKAGDVFMTNSPSAGGSHLPDITVITPCFDEQTGVIAFFVASRAHHADVGGILPGSMPPTSTSLAHEGAEIVSLKVVENGVFNREAMVEALVDVPARVEGSSGCRNIFDVESDLKAQIASNHKGIQLLHEIIAQYSLPTVVKYMVHIQNNAAEAIRTLLRQTARRLGPVLEAIDYLDDGSPIQLKITIDEPTGSAVFDFEGTGCEVRGNLNAPLCVTSAATIYCLRAMIESDIPLNAGCLVPIDIRVPHGSLLSPSQGAAVCGGNVLTSQRITDVVLKAFRACAASQGCTNNLSFGEPPLSDELAGWGMYETIGGGSGAGKDWNGTSCHTHMTNTKITDPEILERRYPVVLREFSIRKDTGGKGQFSGGDGLVRDLEWRVPLQVSILSERRTYRPYGMEGGEDGQCGRNFYIKQRRAEDGDLVPDSSEQPPRQINLGGKATVKMHAGDRIRIETPGGGGFGRPLANSTNLHSHSNGHANGVEFAPRGSFADRANVEF